MANGVKNKSLDPTSESVSIFKFTTASEIMNHCLKLIYKLFHQGTKNPKRSERTRQRTPNLLNVAPMV